MAEPSFTASIIRPDDLLVLSFDFFNLQLETAPGNPARLRRVASGEPAHVAVRLPPQHVAEDLEPVPQARMANTSRLVFALPDGTDAIDFTLASLLGWGRLEPSLTANAAADAPADRRVLIPDEPTPTETAIELPYRLVLSPDETGRWAHSVEAVTRDAVSELWHTRLGVGVSEGVDESRLPGLRAVWSRDLVPHDPGLNFADDGGLNDSSSPLTRQNRADIVRMSSFFGQEILLLDPVRDPDYYIPPALVATHLTLSALGGWTDMRGDWDFPLDPHVVFPNQGTSSALIVAWRHVVAQGRDQYVRVVTRGSLYPLGHRADQIMVFERRLGPGGVADGIVKILSTVVVREPSRDYAALGEGHPEGSRLPLRTARIETLTTPPQQADAGNPSFIVTGEDGQHLAFHVVGTDWTGAPLHLHMPLVFVPADGAGNPQDVYRDVNTVAVGQPVALAFAPAGAATLPVQTLTFDAIGTSTALPFVTSASVSVPAVDHLVGSAAPTPPACVVNLVDPITSVGNVFAVLPDPLRVDLPPQRAGGVAKPGFAVGALSTARGALPGGLDDLASIKDKIFERMDARLLGSVNLKDVVGTIANFDQLPQVLRTESPGGVDIAFTWSPPLVEDPPPPLKLHDGASLTLSSTLHIPVGAAADSPRAHIHGVLTSFSIDFLGVVEVAFTSITFDAEDGRPLSVRPSGIEVRLQRELEFLNALADMLPADGFSDGPAIEVTPRGVTAGYAVGLPAAGIGIFSLENVALSTGVTLPFDGTPAAVRLAFSSRANPFLATVSMIGGAGFFALEVDTEGVRRIEGAIEVGANMTVDLAIVAANVHVMAGFFFGLQRVDEKDQIDFSAYLRIGGSVELLGIAGVSVDINLSMSLELDGDKPVSIGGRASVVVSVHLLMFSKSLTLSTEKHFAIAPNDPTFDELISEEDWKNYCLSFA